MKTNKNKYKTLEFYNTNIKINKNFKDINTDDKLKEKYGAFSIASALKSPQILNPHYIQYPGVT